MITKDINIIELVQSHPEAIEVLQAAGMGCIGCMAARFESLEQGAHAHGINIDKMVEDINAAIAKA
ncbi:MAG: DUF1858 domain-containing protein [Bacillota bacterium]